MKTTNGKRGGNLVGKPHNDKSGKPVGGIKAVVTDAGGKPVELEGGEVIINKEASKKHWKELSRINQSAGNGVPISPPVDPHDEDPTDYEVGGKIIEFNRNHLPNKWILSYAKGIKKDHPEIWKLGGNIYGNTAFENLCRVSARGYWLDSEEWMYKKWQSFLARHQHDFRIAGVVAVLKWGGKVNKGWKYMKDLIEAKISKSKAKPKSMKVGGKVVTYKMKFNKKYGFESNESHSLAEIAKLTKLKISALQDIYDKGIGAYKTNPQSVRPNVKSKEQWAMARVYSAVMGGKAAKVDANELQRGKKYADGGSVGFENTLFNELAQHNAPSFKDGGEIKDAFENTKKLIEELKKHSFYEKGTVSISKDGRQRYRYDHYKLRYPNSSNWLVKLFEKAAEENTGKPYHTQFFHTNKYSFSYDRPKFRGLPNGRMSMSELILM